MDHLIFDRRRPSNSMGGEKPKEYQNQRSSKKIYKNAFYRYQLVTLNKYRNELTTFKKSVEKYLLLCLIFLRSITTKCIDKFYLLDINRILTKTNSKQSVFISMDQSNSVVAIPWFKRPNYYEAGSFFRVK